MFTFVRPPKLRLAERRRKPFLHLWRKYEGADPVRRRSFFDNPVCLICQAICEIREIRGQILKKELHVTVL
jgi:hypothetical protein